MLTTILVLLLGIVTILVIIAANGYFVAQEFSYMSVDRNRLAAQAEAGDATGCVSSRSPNARPSCSPARSWASR